MGFATNYLPIFLSKSTVPKQKRFSGSKLYSRFQKMHSSNVRHEVLTPETINPNVKMMEYAVRGPIVIRAVEIEAQLSKGHNFPFTSVIKANIGDAQAMGQKPITFIRQVLACVADPSLIGSNIFPTDVNERSRALLQACAGGSAGSYSQSTGIDIVRKHVSKFIEDRDGISSNWENICLFGGASEAIRSVLKLFINRDEKMKAGIMIPIPQYPLYSASIEEFNLGQVGYYLDEENKWALNINELERAYQEGQTKYNIKAIVVINPGNPTGQVLTQENIESIIKFAREKNLFIFADEVYQENVYASNAKFHSFKKVMSNMGNPYNAIELASFYSCSKGYMGECGLRGGYVEFVNLNPHVYTDFKKMVSAKLCSTVLGQVVMDCVVNPPKLGDPSYDQWKKEKLLILESLRERAQLVTKSYNAIEGISLQEVQGAMYAFPRVTLPENAIKIARENGLEPDFFYVKELLETTGVCVVPGSGFGQMPGTYHFRTTILPQPDVFMDMLERFKNFHLEFMSKFK